MKHSMKGVPVSSVQLTDGFWKTRTHMVATEAIPYQWRALNDSVPGVPKSHAVENFRIAAGEADGDVHGMVFQDSDIGKWIEAASYALLAHRDPAIEEQIDALVRVIGKAQQSDGYINTFFTLVKPEERWSELVQGHELYSAGHLIEAAVAYHEVTGKREFLEIMVRFADHIDEVFGPEEGKLHLFDGHPEVELALYRLAEATGTERYARLADYFLDVRGSIPDFSRGRPAKEGMIDDSRWFYNDYYNAQCATRDLRDAEGHAVRAVYLYSGLADQYGRTGDDEILTALRALWKSVVERRMYVTAGLGSQARGERFTVDYDLPGDTAYAETCASVGFVFWAWRMTLIDPNREYADIAERALYNGALGGIALDGHSYHYVNALEVRPEVAEYRHDHDHVEPERVGWFECACCPTNVARLVASIGAYLVSHDEETVWIHQYVSARTSVPLRDGAVDLAVQSGFPWDGRVTLTMHSTVPERFSVYVRIPEWADSYAITVDGSAASVAAGPNGYAAITADWSGKHAIGLSFDMAPRLVRANDKVAETAGRVAIQRGPLIYCVEEVDNGPDLHQLIVDPRGSIRVERDDSLVEGGTILVVPGHREIDGDEAMTLYRDYRAPRRLDPCQIRAVPFFMRGNRGRGEHRVWVRVGP